jgi:hypothetical protein
VSAAEGKAVATRARGHGTADRLIGLAAPILDLILAIGDRVSRIAEPDDYEYYPIRPASERELPERIEPNVPEPPDA